MLVLKRDRIRAMLGSTCISENSLEGERSILLVEQFGAGRTVTGKRLRTLGGPLVIEGGGMAGLKLKHVAC